MGLLRSLELICRLGLTTSPSNSIATLAHLPSYPLAVKSPYLSTWVPGNQILDNAATAQPKFWNGQNLSWPIVARVNGETFSLFGLPDGALNTTAATTSSVSYTSSHTYVKMTAGSANIILDFFSPVLPGKEEYARQSLPYSYLTVSATSSSSKPPKVQVMSAVDYTWTAQNGQSNVNYTTCGDAGFFWFYNPNQIAYTESRNMATYGSVLFGASSDGNITHGCGGASEIYASFATRGSLANVTLQGNCTPTDLTALAKDLGTCGHTSSSANFVVGFNRDLAINYLDKPQTGFHRTQWPTVPEAIEHVLEDYHSVFSSSIAFDAAIRSKAEAVSSTFGSKYADIIEASVRQTFGGMDLTVPADNLSYYPPDAFLKEISSDGNVNTVDFIFQSWPIFISLNPEYIRLLLQPIMLPNATGHDNGVEEHMPLFETSALFILLYAYQKYTGDTAYAANYTSMLNSYAEWMAPRALYHKRQLISVDSIRPTANQTALAIQSTIGLNAAGILLNNSTYSRVAADYVNTLYYGGLGLDGTSPADSTHFTYNYDGNQTWNVLFTSYPDVLLDLNTFPQAAWDLQSDWYLRQMQEGGLAFAGPVDDLHYTGRPLNWGLTDWNELKMSQMLDCMLTDSRYPCSIGLIA
ncbi:hypothetical protein LTR37_015477 [Vermiconidia calcicola]|uniref:Uncharacterized protein n=1 Tax=Vermiconidia calcicola TaxID=1690605 RepID=A0ACC3MRV0_9PEZI|nr:hypothetical protein LTR37_015477 [Vermiconidia calcicola]